MLIQYSFHVRGNRLKLKNIKAIGWTSWITEFCHLVCFINKRLLHLRDFIHYVICQNLTWLDYSFCLFLTCVHIYGWHVYNMSCLQSLIVRLLFWQHIKLMIICWLVLPHFDGAIYVYNHFIHPCLSMNPPIFVDEFNKWKDFLLKRDNFLAQAERYINKNGPEALEELIATKVWHFVFYSFQLR